MRPELFGTWCLEKLSQKDGLLPPLEANQGLIALLLFVFVFFVLLAQAKRARNAELRAVKAERERKQEVESIQETLRRFQDESLARERTARDRIEEERKIGQVRQFVATANGIISSVLHLLDADQARAEADPEVELARPTQVTKRHAAVAGSSLTAILSNAPMDPALIIFTRETAQVLDILANTPPLLAEQADQFTLDFKGLLGGALHTMLAQEKRLLADLGVTGAAASVH